MANSIRVPLTINGDLRHGSAVRLLEKHDVPAPAEYVALRDRIDAYTVIDRPLTDRLIAAILTGDGADQAAEYRAAAIAEAIRSDVDEKVATAAHGLLRELYETVAPDSYQAIAARYNEVAREFTVAARTVSPWAPADEVIDLDAKAQKLWRRGKELSAQLDELSILLQTAAMLCGVENAYRNERESSLDRWHEGQKSMLIGLACNPGDIHRRRVWEAFDQGWSALVALGVELRAVDLASYERYREPKPVLQRKQLRPDGIYEYVPVDPEDPDYEAA